jgi:ATP-dependent helicase/nuclease subunit A
VAARAARDDALMKEHRRLFYVALTRARDRLCICGFHGVRGAAQNSWYELARAAAEADGVEVTRDGSQIRVIGTVEEEAHGAARTAASPPPPLPDWMGAPAPAEQGGPGVLHPSDLADPSASTSPLKGGRARFLRGNVVHTLLARLPEVPREARRAIGLNYARGQGIADAEGLLDETLAVLDDPLFAAAFAPGSRAETALLADVPGIGRVNGRIDRLAVTDAEVLILDFKTNRPPPARAEDVGPVYRAQLALYRAAAALVFPGRRIVCGLVFTDGPSLVTLPDALLDAALAQIPRNRGENPLP